MGAKMLLLSVALVTFISGSLADFRVLSRMGPREIEGLLKTVDPSTCRCSYQDRCQIVIPDVSMVGIRCLGNTQFCCRARAIIKPYLNPNDWAELHAAVKRLKVEQQLMSLVVNKSPEEVQHFLSRDRIAQATQPPPPPLPTTAATTTTTDSTTTTQTTTTPSTTTSDNVVYLGDQCLCVDLDQCSPDQMDFSFGRSCRYGQVRCCLDLPDPELSEITNTLEENRSNQVQLQETTTTITTTTTTSTSTTPTTTELPTTTSTTTTAPNNLDSHRLPTSEYVPSQFSSSSFYRYSVPSVYTKRPQIFFDNLNNVRNDQKIFFTTARPRYQPPPIQNVLVLEEDPKYSNAVQGYRLPSDIKPGHQQSGGRRPAPLPLVEPTPSPSQEEQTIRDEPSPVFKSQIQNRKIVVGESENEEANNSEITTKSKIEQEESYHKYLAQVQLQRQLMEFQRRQRLEQERQSSFVGQIQNAVSSAATNLFSLFG